ncbi:MAG: ribosome silencing factor [Acidimicrobiales bacterium]|jgi:ribosome-associated protein|nr:ribosome silencing factor [Acidimicrobiaceae bacterium]MBT5207448.1 ribosome silencing factor [Acidimicrobiaceae bacterium]MBT5569391.1 ribosome silencing factor [Acidimicrobiaceae bacterium]MBT6091980.1 ribosome silencing factor [Acidimicrobiaceae bacterium]MDG2160182.1 ribosome silencing factor [Acidimicrobiales bacterium]
MRQSSPGQAKAPADVSDVTLADWARHAARAADDKLGRDTIIIAVGEVISVTDFFVISSAQTSRQVRAIAEEIEEQLTILDGPKPLRVEGRTDHRWVLMDFGGFVVHILDDEYRAFYDLERLWSDCPRIEWQGA